MTSFESTVGANKEAYYTYNPVENYSLHPDVKFIPGINRAALYDLNSGNVYSINGDAARIMSGEVDNVDFWRELSDLGLTGRNTTKSNQSRTEERLSEPYLSFAWLEVTPDCNETCIHCYGLFGRPQPEYQSLSFEEWTRILNEISETGCNNIQFIGGEPFMYKDKETSKNLMDLIMHARKSGIENIEVFTNGTMLTDRTIENLKSLDVKMAVSIYSNDPDVHDNITQLPGSHRLTMKGLDKLKAAGIPTRLGLVAMRQNQSTIKQTIELFEDINLQRRKPDVVRPCGGGQNLPLQPTLEVQKAYGLRMRPNFRINDRTYNKHLSNNPCLSGKIAVSYNGDVFPCIFSRDFPVGNIREKSIIEIIHGNLVKEVWETTKDDVLVCQDCEYRYACHDCRPLALNSNPDANYLSAPPARCTYNPYTGTWGEGVWRLNSDREPIYTPLEEVFKNHSNPEAIEIGGDK